jgi:hypothetical protein
MELGQPIDVNNFSNAYATYQEFKDSNLGRSYEPYFDAIGACLHPTITPHGSFEDEDIIDQVWHKIVNPLKDLLYTAFPKMKGKLSSPSRSTDVLSSDKLLLLDRKAPCAKGTGVNNFHIPRSATISTSSLTYSPPQQPTPSIQTSILQNRNGYINRTAEVYLHVDDDDDDDDVANDKRYSDRKEYGPNETIKQEAG